MVLEVATSSSLPDAHIRRVKEFCVWWLTFFFFHILIVFYRDFGPIFDSQLTLFVKDVHKRGIKIEKQ